MHQKHTLFTLSFIFIDIKNVYQFINSGKLECSPPGKAGVPGLFTYKGETWCLIGSEQKEKEPFLLIGSCCFEVYQFLGGTFLMSHYLYLDHVIQDDNCDLYSTRYIFNLVSHYFYSAYDANKMVGH